MATKSEVFPDLHHKMSKKIAQLTKVIYHLNTRNEDHQSEVDSLNNFHQNEIQQILRDSTNKINKLKEQLESRQIQVIFSIFLLLNYLYYYI
jgi:ssDNA-specific exonuclease RecJ